MKPILFELFGTPVYSYGAALGLAAAVCGCWGRRLCSSDRLSLSSYLDVCLITALGAVFGARLGFFFQAEGWSLESAAAAARFWEKGGASSLGILAVVGPSLLLYFRLKRLPALQMLDDLVPLAFLAAFIQRGAGCFLAGCCAGVPTGMPWGVVFPGSTQPVHPTQLYLGLGSLIFWIWMMRLESRRLGGKTVLALTLHAGLNLAVNPFRELAGPTWLGVSAWQWAYAALASAGLTSYLALNWKQARWSGSEARP